MVKKARAAGSFIGGILGNPFLVLGGILLGALLIFRKDITGAFGSLGSGISQGLGDININLPSIELPSITFPELPSLPSLDFLGGLFNQQKDISGEQTTLDGAPLTFGEGTTFDKGTGVIEGAPPTVDLGLGGGISPTGEIAFNQLRSQVFDTLTQTLGLSPSEAFGALKDVSFQDGLKGLDAVLQSFNKPLSIEIQDPPPFQALFGFDDTVLQSLGTDQVFTGGGVGFQGGSVSPTPITTLTQVLDLFPNLTASQAADFLGEFSGILPEAALMQGGDVINISQSPLDPPQMFNQSSLGTENITPEQLFKLLFPTIISNF